eukprot:630902-Prymnesium_polylepis.1
MDSKCDSSRALMAALHLTRDAFDGRGVQVIIGAGCSGASVVAAQVASSSHVPVVSGSSLSPSLSDGIAYPYFVRTPPADDFKAFGMVDILLRLLGYSRLALVSSTDEYGVGGARTVRGAAAGAGVEVSASITFRKDATQFQSEHQHLRRIGATVIVLICQSSDGVRCAFSKVRTACMSLVRRDMSVIIFLSWQSCARAWLPVLPEKDFFI